MPTINDLRQQAATIKNATQVGENTATRVGGTFETVADLLEQAGGGGQGIPSVDLSQLNALRTPADQTDANPTVYNVTTMHTLSGTTIKVGTLFVFSDGARVVVTQVLVSNYQVDGGGNISSPNTSQITIYYRMFNIVQETWSTWTLYAGGSGGGTIDPYPVSGSDNAVASNGVFERLQEAAPKVDISEIDDIDEYSDMLATKPAFYTVTTTLARNVFRIGTLMEFANQGRYILYQILATDFVLNEDGTLDTTLSENGGLKLIWRMKQFSSNPPEGVTIGEWSKWSYLSGGGGGEVDAYTKNETDTLLAQKQNILTFDNVPTANSNNPVKSGGVKTAIDAKQDTISDLATIRSGAALGATALQSYTETDPVYSASAASGITSSNITSWNGKAEKIAEINHGTSDTTFALTPNIHHVWGEVTSLTFTLATGEAGIANEYMFRFYSGTTPTTLNLPSTVQWVQPLTCQQDKYYEVSIVNNLAVYITSGMAAAESSGGTPEYATKDWVTNKIETEIDGGYYYV